MVLVATVIIVVNGKMTFFENYIYNFNTYNSTGDPFNLENSAIITVSGASCNNKCTYCFLNQCTEPVVPKLNSEKLVSCIKRFSNDLNKKVTIWAGEPLFNKETFIKLCDIINTTLPNHVICIYTNGTLINDWWADYFKDHKVHIMISHDGPGQKYRGFDFLSSDSHIKAIKKIYDNGNLSGVNSVIHCDNYSFFDIVDFFENIEKKTGIIFNSQIRTLVGGNLFNKIPLNFDYMDKRLMKYIIDSYAYLFKALLKNDYNTVLKYFTRESVADTMPILQEILGIPVYKAAFCNTSQNKISIDTKGNHVCLYGGYLALPEECYTGKQINTLNKCSKCEIAKACPIQGCLRLSIDNNMCNQAISRYKTIRRALTILLDSTKNNNNSFSWS